MARINVEPRVVFEAFEALSDIPRCSKHEEAVIAWIKKEAEGHGLPWKSDAVGNLLVMVPATPGKEQIPGIIIQGHVDMVCEKTRDSNHDFSCQGLDLYIDGQWLKARGTSLGADNGIAVAMMMAVMKKSCVHGPVDLLFTIDEETGLTGALGLDPALLRYDLLLNIDSEEEHALYIGCAGGIETEAEFSVGRQTPPASALSVRLTIEGLTGGHSGTDINSFRANALVLLGRVLHDVVDDGDISLAEIHGGDKHNVIPREAWADLMVAPQAYDALVAKVQSWSTSLSKEWGSAEPNLRVHVEKTGTQRPVLDPQSSFRIRGFMRVLPHGVLSMSRHIPGLVATSTNFASFHLTPAGEVSFLSSQRSDTFDTLHDAADKVALAVALAGGKSWQTNEYPSWSPDPTSPLLLLSKAVYHRVYGREALVKSIHAGLETGVIGARRPGIKMISCGPDILGAHSPQERLNIESTARVWHFVTELLGSLGEVAQYTGPRAGS